MARYEVRSVEVLRTHSGGVITVDATGSAKCRRTCQVVNTQTGQVVAQDVTRREAGRIIAEHEQALLNDPNIPWAERWGQ